MRLAPSALIGVLGCVLAFSSLASSKPALDYEDVFALEYAASPHFFANGDDLMYVRRSADKFTDSMSSSVWKIDLDSDNHEPLLHGIKGLQQVTLSPNNQLLAYVAATAEGPQIFVRYLALNKTIQLTQLSASPSSLTWAPSGKQLYFIQKVDVTEKPLFSDMPKPPKGATWAEPAQVVDSIRYRADGGGYLKPGYDHLFRIDAEGGMVEQITTGDINFSGPINVSADNETILMSSNLHDTPELVPLGVDIVAVNAKTGEHSVVTQHKGAEFSPQYSPDGNWLAYLRVDDIGMAYQLTELVLHDLKNGAEQRLSTQLDRTVTGFAWSPNSDYLLFSYLDAGQTKLAEVRVNGDIKGLPITLGGQVLGRPYVSGEFAVSAKGDIAFTSSEATYPAELLLMEDDDQVRPLTTLNSDWLSQRQLSTIEQVQVKSSIDERMIEAWFAYPPNFDEDKRYPMILEIHGGPHAAYGPQFSMEVQLMAAKGYVVVWSNPRGSSSYGAEFANLIHHNYPSNDYQDLMDVVDVMAAKPFVDNDNLFITGGSGGGVLTAWSIGKTDRFRAAVVAKPVINWISFALTADAYPFFTQYWMPDMPWNDHEALWQRSPLSLVGNVSTPTMLLTGEADYRTPISETEQYYQALKLRQVDSVMVRIPDASHGITARPSRMIQKVGHIIAWFDQYKTSPAQE